MTIFIYKVIAMVTMVIDHFGLAFLDSNFVFRTIGRISFPVYAFLLAEAFRHIRSDEARVKSHLIKLFILAIVSEFPYDLFLYGLDFSSYFSWQSNMMTLLIAYIGLIGFNKVDNRPLSVAVISILTAFCSYFLHTDYPFVGVLFVYSYYWYLNTVMSTPKDAVLFGRCFKTDSDGNIKYGYIKRALLLMCICVIYVIFKYWFNIGFDVSSFDLESFVNYYLLKHSTILLISFLFAMYNGKIGYDSPVFKTVFSLFYPFHLAVFGLIELFLGLK